MTRSGSGGSRNAPERRDTGLYTTFGLVLTTTHDCNLRCRYCYAGRKSPRAMPAAVAFRAVDRALASVAPGGTLELGFFGGEPLLEPDLIEHVISYAALAAFRRDVEPRFSMTTNGTLTGPKAWSLMAWPAMDLAVSHDGLPEVHNRYRRRRDGAGSSAAVLRTIRRLIDAGRDPAIVMVVRPDTVQHLPAGVLFLHGLSVTRVEPNLDLWAQWSPEDIRRLERAVDDCADIWRDALPRLRCGAPAGARVVVRPSEGLEGKAAGAEGPEAWPCVTLRTFRADAAAREPRSRPQQARVPTGAPGWFDEKLVGLARLPMPETARCGFGDGEVAVAPSGRLYPCERLIGEDDPGNPMRLPGHVSEGTDFLSLAPPPCRAAGECARCAIQGACSTTCRCSNYVRTGNPTQPDALLCRLNKACARDAAQTVLDMSVSALPPAAPLAEAAAG